MEIHQTADPSSDLSDYIGPYLSHIFHDSMAALSTLPKRYILPALRLLEKFSTEIGEDCLLPPSASEMREITGLSEDEWKTAYPALRDVLIDDFDGSFLPRDSIIRLLKYNKDLYQIYKRRHDDCKRSEKYRRKKKFQQLANSGADGNPSASTPKASKSSSATSNNPLCTPARDACGRLYVTPSDLAQILYPSGKPPPDFDSIYVKTETDGGSSADIQQSTLSEPVQSPQEVVEVFTATQVEPAEAATHTVDFMDSILEEVAGLSPQAPVPIEPEPDETNTVSALDALPAEPPVTTDTASATSIDADTKTSDSQCDTRDFAFFKTDGPVLELTSELEAQWRSLFPSLDIHHEIHLAQGWSVQNPRKQRKDLKRFIFNWLKRAAQHAPVRSVPPPRTLLAERPGYITEPTWIEFIDQQNQVRHIYPFSVTQAQALKKRYEESGQIEYAETQLRTLLHKMQLRWKDIDAQIDLQAGKNLSGRSQWSKEWEKYLDYWTKSGDPARTDKTQIQSMYETLLLWETESFNVEDILRKNIESAWRSLINPHRNQVASGQAASGPRNHLPAPVPDPSDVFSSTQETPFFQTNYRVIAEDPTLTQDERILLDFALVEHPILITSDFPMFARIPARDVLNRIQDLRQQGKNYEMKHFEAKLSEFLSEIATRSIEHEKRQ